MRKHTRREETRRSAAALGDGEQGFFISYNKLRDRKFKAKQNCNPDKARDWSKPEWHGSRKNARAESNRFAYPGSSLETVAARVGNFCGCPHLTKGNKDCRPSLFSSTRHCL